MSKRLAESRSDVIHKLGMVLKELNESRAWLEMIQKREYVHCEIVAPALDECIALSKIIGVSRRTAAENAGRIRQASATNRRARKIAGLQNIHDPWIMDN